MKTIRCIAVDDEPPAIRQMEEYILRVPYLNLAATFENAMDAMEFLKSNTVDLLFLDIQMDHLSGIEMLNLLKEKPRVILTTAFDSYALQAFDLEVDDYLLKPISFERFLKATEKIYSQKAQQEVVPDSNDESKSGSRDFFFVKTEFRTQRIDFAEILYIEGMKEYLIIQTNKDKIYTLQSFHDILETLPSDNFHRVHKSYIVALDKIDSIRKNRIYVGDKVIPIGATFRESVMKLVN